MQALSESLGLIIVPVTPFQQNCSLLVERASSKAALVDPGGEPARIRAVIEREGLSVQEIWITHGHCDHAGATAQLAEELEVAVLGPQAEDRFWIESLPVQAQSFGLGEARSFEPDRWLEDGDQVQLGELVLEVLHTPGHTPGHVVFYHRESAFCVVGDVLFSGGIGRTDFPRGVHGTLIRSIREKLFPLGDEVSFLPGHGPCSSFGRERRTNPFLRS